MTRTTGEYGEQSFSFPGNDALALDSLNLEIPPGAFVAVTGPVGSGKSALARALLGLYPLGAGRVLLDGRHCRLNALIGSSIQRNDKEASITGRFSHRLSEISDGIITSFRIATA